MQCNVQFDAKLSSLAEDGKTFVGQDFLRALFSEKLAAYFVF
jgi:hypothetical protein